ncbi:MAG: spore cortex biosynthesis protein YabQ [Acutalibacteraceae bacterium]
MTISLAGQTTAFLYSCALGAALCVIYDVFRAIRMFFLPRRVLVAFLDILYFFLAAVFTFAFFMAVSQGEVRGYLYFGELIGWLLYYETIGSLLFRLQNKIFAILRRTAKKIAAPFRRFGRKLPNHAPNRHSKPRKAEKSRILRKKRLLSAAKALATRTKNSV